MIQHRLVAAHAGEVIDIAGLGQTHNRVDQQVGLRFFCRTKRQFLMRAVQRVAGLKRHNAAPAHFAEIRAQLIWRVARAAEIVMHWLLDTRHRAAQVDFARLVMQVIDGRVGVIIGAKHHLRLARFVRLPLIGHRHRAQDHTFLVAQRDILAQLNAISELFAHIQRDWHWPQLARAQAHILNDAVIIGLGQKAFQRVEAAIHQQLQITDLAWRQIMRGQLGRLCFHLLSRVKGDKKLRDRGQVILHQFGPVAERCKSGVCAR